MLTTIFIEQLLIQSLKLISKMTHNKFIQKKITQQRKLNFCLKTVADYNIYLFQTMGNSEEGCCAQDIKITNKIPLFSSKSFQSINSLIQLTDQQHQFINKKHLFPQQLTNYCTLKCGPDLYQGEIDENGKPQGYGILQSYNSQAIFFTKFHGIWSDSQVYYILPNGSYFLGNLTSQNLVAGTFCDPQQKYQYQGQFQAISNKDFKFTPDGKGIETTQNYYFEGTFSHGKRVSGKLKWIQRNFQHQYEGKFNNAQQFTGKGTLKEQTGTYIGQFKDGLKHGLGRYQFSTGLVYEGDYQLGKKNGQGKLKNSDGSLSYSGEFLQGLPHGRGIAYMQSKASPLQFTEGISKNDFQLLVTTTPPKN